LSINFIINIIKYLNNTIDAVDWNMLEPDGWLPP